MPQRTLYKSDVDALGSKLEKFAEDLPEQEKEVLAWLMARARNASSQAELSEEDLEAVAGGQLAGSLGLQPDLAEEVKVTVSWSK